jgi:hypothetical protein
LGDSADDGRRGKETKMKARVSSRIWLPVLAAVVAIGGFGVFPATAAPRVVLGEEFTATW